VRAIGWLLVLIGALAAAAGAWAVGGQAASGAQPWSDELSDNFIFAKLVLFAVGLGVAVGLLRGLSWTAGKAAERRPDGAIRRFSTATVIGHAILALGVLLALPTGAWQYLGGILDVTAPIPLFLFYRLHYVGATLILFASSSFVTYWWLAADRSLQVGRGQWAGHLRGLADELPRPLGDALARLLRIDLGRRPPEAGRFSFYEKVVSFPTWELAIALITLTGVVKAVRYVFPIPGPVLFWSSTLHVAAMVLILLKVLDHLRYTLGRWPLLAAMVTTWASEGAPRPRRLGRLLAAALGSLWALANLLLAYFFVTSAFVAKTAAKEGLPAQLSLLVGGALIEILAVALLWRCFTVAFPRDGTAS